MCHCYLIFNKTMSRFKTIAKNLVIPANSPANVALQFEFKHNVVGNVKGVGFGLAEVSNPNNKHFNFGLNVIESEPTIDPVSKNFYTTNGQNPLSERFVALQFDKPSNETSVIKLIPTAASGADDIVVQFVFKYELID